MIILVKPGTSMNLRGLITPMNMIMTCPIPIRMNTLTNTTTHALRLFQKRTTICGACVILAA